MNKRGKEFRISFNCGEEAFDINDRYINVVIPFDEEVGEAMLRAIRHSIMALNDGDGIHPSFSEEELIKSNERITRKEITEYFGVSPRTIKRYMNQIKSAHYVGSGKSGRWDLKKKKKSLGLHR